MKKGREIIGKGRADGKLPKCNCKPGWHQELPGIDAGQQGRLCMPVALGMCELEGMSIHSGHAGAQDSGPHSLPDSAVDSDCAAAMDMAATAGEAGSG